MKNIICIDLKMFNHVKLQEVCDKYGLNYDTLLQNKYDGFAKIWIDTNTNLIVAFNTKKNSNVQQSEAFSELLMNISPVEITKQPRKLDLDSILEKISAYGIDSLKQDEKDFLKSL